MNPAEIVVGMKYSNPTEKYGGVRIVDAIISRSSGQRAVRWTNALPRQTSSGHAQGVSTLSTFAKWARVAEQMTASEQDAHARRAAAHQDATERYGEWASKIVAARQPGTCSG